MISFTKLIYNLLLPSAKKEGIDPETVAKKITKKKEDLRKSLMDLFDEEEIISKDGKRLKFSDLFPNG